jgi:hypothetical protein
VLRWAAADTAAGWTACTKKLSAFSWIKGPARESGAFLFVATPGRARLQSCRYGLNSGGFSHWGPRIQPESWKGRTVAIVSGDLDQSALYRVQMNIIPVPFKIFQVTNAVIRETSLPNFAFALEFGAYGMRITSLDELHRALQRDVHAGLEHQMHVFGHHDELVQLESPLPLVSVESFQEESGVGLDDKKSSALPGCETYEIGAGWGPCASGLHGIPQRLEAALL